MNGPVVNAKNLKRLCWTRGMSVTELARRIGKSRVSVYRAMHHPSRYRVAHALILEVLQ